MSPPFAATLPLERHPWPETGHDNPAALLAEIAALPSVYESGPRPFSFPGTAFLDVRDPGVGGMALDLLAKQYNLLGTHSRGIGGKWGPAQAIERKAVGMVLSLFGADEESADGYFCAGGTEANLVGMWIGREWLLAEPPTADRRIAALATPVAHYSFAKGVRLLGLGAVRPEHCPRCGIAHRFAAAADGSGMGYLPMNAAGELALDGLLATLAARHRLGIRKFLLFLNVGTTLLGSVDPIGPICEACSQFARETGSAIFVHVDACFGGFTVPFLEGGPPIGFEHPLVQTVALDADKMGGLPYPSGVFACRKGLQAYIENEVEYLSTMSHADDTLSGSRSALAPLMGYYRFARLGRQGQRAIVRQCLDLRDHLVARLQRPGSPCAGRVGVLPHSPWINIVALRLPPHVLNDAAFAWKHTLRFSYFPTDPGNPDSCPESLLRVNIMPHHAQADIDAFVTDLEAHVAAG